MFVELDNHMAGGGQRSYPLDYHYAVCDHLLNHDFVSNLLLSESLSDQSFKHCGQRVGEFAVEMNQHNY